MSDDRRGQRRQRIPTLAAFLLHLRFGNEVGEALIGDLLEEMAERDARDVGYHGWLWRQTLRSLASGFGGAARGDRTQAAASGGAEASLEFLAATASRTFRALRRRPLLTTVTSLTLAIGIGASTIVLAIAYGVLVRALPFENPDELVEISRLTPEVTGPKPPLSLLAGIYMVPYSLFLDWQGGNEAFVAMGAYAPRRLTLSGDGAAQSVVGLRTTSGVFAALRTEAALGRALLPSDDRVGAPAVAVLDTGLWRSRYGADPGVIGRTITLSGSPYTVVGVMPRDFAFPSEGVRLWCSFSDAEKTEQYRAGGYLKVLARLRRGVSLAAAQQTLDGLARGLGEIHAEERDHGVRVTGLKRLVVDDADRGISILLGGIAMLILLTCANIAGLLLIRLIERRPEIGVRAALGASRWRLVVETISEGVALSLVGGVLGTVIAAVGLRPFVTSFPGDLPRAHEVGVDGAMLAIAVGLSILIGVVIGGVPALRLVRSPLEGVARLGRGAATDGRQQSRLQAGLVVAQVAFAFALLVGAGLFVKSYQRLAATDPGFDPSGLSIMTVVLPDRFRGAPDDCRRFFAELTERLGAIPGVTGVAAVEQVPFLSGMSYPPVFVESGGVADQAAIHVSNVSPSYFRVLGIPALSGRLFDTGDVDGNPEVTVVNRAMAERYWPEEDALGRRVNVGSEKDPEWLTVVGVVENVRYRAAEEPLPEIYRSLEQAPQWYLSVLMASPLGAEGLARQAAAAVHSLDRDIPVTVAGFKDRIARSAGIAGPRFGAFAVSSLAAVAALLAVLGIYGVLAFAVVRRTQEIGIRLALGAQRVALLRSVLARGARLTALGLGVGLMIALAGGRLLEAALFGIHSNDPANLLQAALLVAIAGGGAGLLPARRATKVDPVRTLRRE